MDTYLSINKAATITKLNKQELHALINSGTIRAIKADNQIFVNQNDLIMINRNLPDKLSELENKSILLSEASRKYGISTQTLSKWIKKGYIKILSKSIRRLYLNEADVAYLSEIYKIDPGRGKKTILKYISNPE